MEKLRMSDDEIEELRAAAQYLSRGTLGGFAAHIGDAMLAADPWNLETLSNAFPELIRGAWDQLSRKQKGA